MARYSACWPDYAKRWDKMKITSACAHEVAADANFALRADNRDQYEMVERKTGAPWPAIAVIHRRESDSDFHTYLGNGEPLNRKTRLVPRGRGPFPSWQDGAIDALQVDGLDDWSDWTLEKIIYACETINGFGYRTKKLPSPYLWADTNQQVAGKFVADGKFSRTAWDTQPGCCGILRMIIDLGELQDMPWMAREK